MKIAIIIPARYGSSRFPGKPLVEIAGKTMLARVVEIGRAASKKHDNISLMVATEDQRIKDHCDEIAVPCVITSEDCLTGSDRVLEAARLSGDDFDFIISLQGDAPFTPPDAIERMLAAIEGNPKIEVITPVVKLRWTELDALRIAKKITPFSGTTALIDKNENALWFSKNIIPAIRKEDGLRKDDDFSPVYQHLGLYGYSFDVLKRYVSLSQGFYERLEGLEQLRMLENGISIKTVTLDVALGLAQAGIDSPEDVARAEKILEEYGDEFHKTISAP